MKRKYSFDFSKGHNLKTIISGVLLGILGLAVILQIDDMSWVAGLTPVRTAFYILLTLVAGTSVHEIYHLFIARMMGHSATVKRFPLMSFPALDNLTKWEALGIKLAPAFDLTLIAGLIIAFFPSPLTPVLSIFLIGNLAGSAGDLIQSYYIFQLASQGSMISLTDYGFEIWE